MEMKQIFVCSPLKGDIKKNLRRAKTYCLFVIRKGHIPIAPHLYFSQLLNDNIPADRELGMTMGTVLLEQCEELWVFGPTISEGMKADIKRARQIGLKVCEFTFDTRMSFIQAIFKELKYQIGRWVNR